MNTPKKTPAFFRYFNARLKPFAKPIVWVPPSLFALVALCVWQYQKHPDWLSTFAEQPNNVNNDFIGDLNTLPNNPGLSSLTLPNQNYGLGIEENNAQSSLSELERTQPSATDSSKTNLSSTQKSGLESLLKPAQPQATNSLNLFPLLSSKTLLPGSTNPQPSSSPASAAPEVSALKALLKPNPAPSPENVLGKAMEQVFSQNSRPTVTAPTPTSTPAQTTNNASNSPQAVTPSSPSRQPLPNLYSRNTPNFGTSAVQSPQSSQSQSTSPYYNPYSAPQTYQVPQTPYAQPYYNPYSAPQAYQVPQTPYAQPYYNPYSAPTYQAPQSPYTQPSANLTPVQTPQYQRPVQIYQPGF